MLLGMIYKVGFDLDVVGWWRDKGRMERIKVEPGKKDN